MTKWEAKGVLTNSEILKQIFINEFPLIFYFNNDKQNIGILVLIKNTTNYSGLITDHSC